MPQQVVLSTPAAAAYLGVTENTLRSWAKLGKVAHSKTPTGRLRFTVTDLDEVYERTEKQAS